MRVLAFLVKLPTEPYKGFNDRLAQACQVLRPTAARLALVDDQPKVTLVDVGQGGPVRVAVCPQEAGDDGQAAKTEERLGRVLAAAEGQPVSTIEGEDGQHCLFLWPVVVPALADAGGSPPPAAPAAPAKRSAGRPPFGFKGGTQGWEEHPEEGLIVRTILDCLDSGLTHDRVDRRLMEEHGDWIREHWNPRDRHKLIARIVERADWYRQHLPAEAPEAP